MHHVVMSQSLRPLADDVIQFLAILQASSIGGETSILCQLGLLDSCCQLREIGVVVDGDGTPPVFAAAWVDVVRGKKAVQVAIALLDIAVDGIFDYGGIGQRSGGEGLAEVDPLPAPGTACMAQCANDGKGSTHTSGGIGLAGP